MRKLLLAVLMSASAWIAQGQKIKPGNLILLKEHPVTIQQGHTSPCRNALLIRQLSDSLAKEGFELLDSAKARDKLRAFFKHMFEYSHRNNYTKSVDDVKAYTAREFATTKLYQDLVIYDYSCLDSVQNYMITLYMAPRGNEIVSQSFALPKDSPYRISDVILSLIEREPPKK